MPDRPPTREMCAKRLDRMSGVSLDEVCVALGMPGNASELSRWLRGYRKTAPGRVGPVEVWAALDAAERQKARAS